MCDQGAWFLLSMSGRMVVYPSSTGTCILKVGMVYVDSAVASYNNQ
ncbi:hypothetical protein SLEP1_g1051 [Rubroshorea leprosula]|uniref:Uncharacterized protein n=1 Tax=Rubroshorea leprosula TaxID=152421 RepID=A0AAV5HKV8_9ROSI|nr:hypothetical protein SLEP1_g1051 [Rubroshorea leprosula]